MLTDSSPAVPRRSAAQRAKHAKSSISNGKDVLPNVDGRSLVARRYRDIVGAILADQGGEDQCSESRKQLIRRFAAAAVLAEQLEARVARGEQIDIAEHATLSSTLVRLATRIGIDRRPKDIVPTLSEYLAARASAEPAGEPDDEPIAETAGAQSTTSELPSGIDAVSAQDDEADE